MPVVNAIYLKSQNFLVTQMEAYFETEDLAMRARVNLPFVVDERLRARARALRERARECVFCIADAPHGISILSKISFHPSSVEKFVRAYDFRAQTPSKV